MTDLQFEALVDEQEAGRRLDAFVAARWPQRSRAAWQEAIATGDVTLDGRAARAASRVRAGQRIAATVRTPSPRPPLAGRVPHVVYEDDDLLVLDKPAGLVVHPAPGYTGATLVDALLAGALVQAAEGDEVEDDDAEPDATRPGIVHRLDKDTSGLLVVARHPAAQAHLAAQFKARTVRKRYLALVDGHPRPAAGAIEAPIGRDPRHRARMAVRAGGRYARTTYRTREALARHTLLDVGLETGRTHQIRVHLAAVGHPVAGDPVYGARPPTVPLDRQFLHAYRLEFDSPSTGQRLTLEAGLPANLQAILEALRAGRA